MIKHILVCNIEQVVHTEKVLIQKEDLERICRLLEIEDLSSCSEKELSKLNAKRDDYQGWLDVTFDDGSNLTWDLCSGGSNYYDNVVFTRNGDSQTLDCTYKLDDIEIDAETDIYIVRLEIVNG